jgi:hypothetical protein
VRTRGCTSCDSPARPRRSLDTEWRAAAR